MAGGIYKIYSIATNESYYGSTNNFPRRFSEHKYLWRNGKGNKKIRLLIEKYGNDNFEFQILECCESDEFEEKEKKYIEEDPRSLNVWVSPFSPKYSGSTFGDTMRGKKRKPFYRKPFSEETKKKMSDKAKERFKCNGSLLKGRTHTEEVKKKVSDGLIKYYSNHISAKKGKSLSEEVKKKISISIINQRKNSGL